MKKKLLALFLTLTMVFSAFASLAIFADEAVDAGYTYDEETDTYTVYTADGLIAAVADIKAVDNAAEGGAGAQNEDSTILLAADIDMSEASSAWDPICNYANGVFVGTFDGQGHTISNFTDKNSAHRRGLIARAGECTVKNVTFVDPVVEGGKNTAIIVADIFNGDTSKTVTIENCHIVNGSVVSTNSYYGALIGCGTKAQNVVIKNCTVDAKIEGTSEVAASNHAGLLIGGESATTKTTTYTIENVIATGSVTAKTNAGLIGYCCDINVSLTNVYSLVEGNATNASSVMSNAKRCNVTMNNIVCSDAPIASAESLGQYVANTFVINNVFVIGNESSNLFGTGKTTVDGTNEVTLTVDGVAVEANTDAFKAATVPGVDAVAAQAKIYEMFAENEAMLVAALKAMHEEYDICAYVEVAEKDYFVSAANCTSPAIYYTSCQFCGKASENTFEYGDVQHTYDGTYEITDEAHWAICALCGDKKQGEHVFGDWEITLEPTEETTGLEGRLCECGLQLEERVVPKLDHAHKYTQYTVSEENLKSAATCATKATYYMTCACGAKGEETFQIGELAEHVFETEISSDANNHFYACTVCDAQKDAVIHTFDQKVATAEYKASEAEGEANAQYYFSCVCGVAGQETFEACKLAAHVYDQEVATEAYLASAATCTAKATYYKSCACGEKGEDTFEYGETLPHVYNQEVVNGSYISVKPTCTEKGTYFKSCACGAKGTETFVGGSLATHVYNQEVTTEEYLERAATCTSEARYYKSCECGAKGYTTFKAEGYAAHVFDREIATAAYLATEATCSAKATYYKSCVCGEKGEATFESGETIAHVFDQEVATDAYLASAATCEEEAKYYYSCECGAKGEETFEDGDTADHTYGEWTTVKQPTETAEGSKEKVCTACGDKITEKIAKLPATTVVEEEKGCGSAIGGVSIIIMIAAAGAVIARKKED